MNLPIINTERKIFLIIIILLGIICTYEYKKIQEVNSNNLELRYAANNMKTKYETKITELETQNELLKRVDGELKKTINEKDETILSLTTFTASLQEENIRYKTHTNDLTSKIDSLKGLFGKSNLKIDDSAHSAYSTEFVRITKDFSIIGRVINFYKEKYISKPLNSISEFDTIKFKGDFQILQTVNKKDKLIRVYIKPKSDAIIIDSSKLFLDIDYAKYMDNSPFDDFIKNIGLSIKSGCNTYFKTPITFNSLNLGGGVYFYDNDLTLSAILADNKIKDYVIDFNGPIIKGSKFNFSCSFKVIDKNLDISMIKRF